MKSNVFKHKNGEISCDSMNENSPHRLICLNVWFSGAECIRLSGVRMQIKLYLVVL